MLGVVEHEHVAGWGLGGDDARVLRHEARPVHLKLRDYNLMSNDERKVGLDRHAAYLSLVVDLDLDFDLARDGPEPSELALLVVVVTGVGLGVLVGQLD